MTDPVPGAEPTRDVVPRTDRGLTEAGDAGHKAYVQAKIAEAATQVEKIRDPRDWQRQVELWGDRQLLHDMMMHGHQHLQGRTEAQGWRHEHPQPTTLGPRRHDAAQVVRVAGVEIVGTTTEFKAGWVSKKEGLRQPALRGIGQRQSPVLIAGPRFR